MIQDNYKKGSTYELFVRRANKIGANNPIDKFKSDYFNLLYEMKYNGYRYKGLSYTSHLEKVKKCISNSITKISKRVKNEVIFYQLQRIKVLVGSANEESELLILLNKLIELTQEYKEY